MYPKRPPTKADWVCVGSRRPSPPLRVRPPCMRRCMHPVPLLCRSLAHQCMHGAARGYRRTADMKRARGQASAASAGARLSVSCNGDFEFFLGIPLALRHGSIKSHCPQSTSISRPTSSSSLQDVALGSLPRARHGCSGSATPSPSLCCSQLSTALVTAPGSWHIRAVLLTPATRQGLVFPLIAAGSLGQLRRQPAPAGVSFPPLPRKCTPAQCHSESLTMTPSL